MESSPKQFDSLEEGLAAMDAGDIIILDENGNPTRKPPMSEAELERWENAPWDGNFIAATPSS